MELMLFFFKQKTAYEMRISDWSSEGCSSDLVPAPLATRLPSERPAGTGQLRLLRPLRRARGHSARRRRRHSYLPQRLPSPGLARRHQDQGPVPLRPGLRSEEHTSELQSLIRISYAVFCMKKKNNNLQTH